MLRFKVTIDTDNDAFADDLDSELARILAALAEDIRSGKRSSPRLPLRDINGNTVGYAQWQELY